MHLVVRHLEARLIDQAITEQQDIQVQGARAPAFQAFAALIVFDGLQRIEQVQWRQVTVQRRNGVGVGRLAGQQ